MFDTSVAGLSYDRKLSKSNDAKLLKGKIKMDVDLIFKIAGVGIIVAVLSQLLKRSERDEQALMITIAGLVIVMFMLVGEISRLFDTIKSSFGF